MFFLLFMIPFRIVMKYHLCCWLKLVFSHFLLRQTLSHLPQTQFIKLVKPHLMLHKPVWSGLHDVWLRQVRATPPPAHPDMPAVCCASELGQHLWHLQFAEWVCFIPLSWQTGGGRTPKRSDNQRKAAESCRYKFIFLARLFVCFLQDGWNRKMINCKCFLFSGFLCLLASLGESMHERPNVSDVLHASVCYHHKANIPPEVVCSTFSSLPFFISHTFRFHYQVLKV